MIFISEQPSNPYMMWQLQVQISNLIKLGFSDPYHILVRYTSHVPAEFIQFQRALKGTNFKFFFYRDKRTDWKLYLPSLRPYLLSKHLEAHPEITEFFQIDGDIIFRELPDFSLMPDCSYASDTISYIGAKYLASKSEILLTGMCDIVGIPPDLVRAKELDSGGAQYLMRGTDKHFWEKVESDGVKLYIYMNKFNESFQGHGVQSWCADMWAMLWNLWLLNDCKVHKELAFCWPTQPLKAWNECKILHNAGVTDTTKDSLFFKGEFKSKSPFGVDYSYVNKDFCSIKYVEQIQKCVLQGLK